MALEMPWQPIVFLPLPCFSPTATPYHILICFDDVAQAM